MSSKRTVMLLDFLLRGAEGAEKEALSALYRTAFSQTGEYQLLQRMLNDTFFTGDRGMELYTTGTQALEKGMSKIGEYDNVMADMTYVLENGKKLLEETNAYVHSLRMDPQMLYLISKSDNEAIRKFLTALVNVVCYYVTVLYGPEALSEFRFDPDQPGLDMLRTVNSGVSSLINNLRGAAGANTWVITRRQFRGRNPVHFDGFGLEYNGVTLGELTREYMSISPFLYYPKADSSVLCAGVGLFTNLNVLNGASALSAPGGVQTHMDVRAFSSQYVGRDRPDLIALVNRTLGNRICAVPPSEIVSALNRCMMIDTVERRRSANVCPLCGKPFGECRGHIRIARPENGFSDTSSLI